MKGLLLALSCISLGAAALPPDQEAATLRLADESLIIELVASEPNVLSPVAITWDARGRMFVAEMIDYPIGPGSGQIRMLEDLDGDGVYEKAVVFAENLPFPNGVLPWRDGLLVTSAPNILFLRDSDGDGHADARRVILTGFAEGNQQLRVNGLFWGLDGWVYGANGRSDGELRPPGEQKSVSLRGHDFRFKPDTGEFEAIAGRSQFGLGHDDWGNRFLSWNTIAIRHEVIPERFLARNPHIPTSEAIHDLAPDGDQGEVFPLTPAPQTFNNESISHFNALAGLSLYRGDALPAQYYGNAFVGESLRNLVHRRVLEPSGPTFVARRAEQGKEFLASKDPWFHPVNFATGPDGTLYIVDFYRQWVEHPGYVPEKLRDNYPWRTGAEHGRIWRVRPREWKRPALEFERLQKAPLAFLGEPNGWWRDTASRLIREDPKKADIQRFRTLVRPQRGVNLFERVHALYLLDQLNALDSETLLVAFRDRHPRIRETALRLAEKRPDFYGSVAAQAEAGDPAVRLWAALILRDAAREIRVPALATMGARRDLDHILGVAIRSSAGSDAGALVQKIREKKPHATPSLIELIQTLAEDAMRREDAVERNGLISACMEAAQPSDIDLAQFAGLTRAAGKAELGLTSPTLRERFIPLATTTVTDPRSSEIARRTALQVLVYLARAETSPILLGFLLPPHPDSLQRAAAKAVVESGEPALFAAALKSWESYQIAIRRQLLGAASRSAQTAAMLVEAMKAGQIATSELDAFQRQSLLRAISAELKPELEKLIGSPVSADRAAIIEKFSPALQLSGDKAHGRQLFEKTCAQCHTFAGSGGNVGPTLAGINARPKEALLVDILDPSRQVAPEFLSYTIHTGDGESLTGLLVSENSAGLTLRRPNLPDETIPRSRVKSVQAGKVSLMPDGIDAGMSLQDMADLMQFITQP